MKVPELSDEHRYPTKKGRKVVREVGRVLRDLGVEFDAILTSPLVRATQTAELIAERTDYVDVIIEALPALAPGIPPRIVANELPSRGCASQWLGTSQGCRCSAPI